MVNTSTNTNITVRVLIAHKTNANSDSILEVVEQASSPVLVRTTSANHEFLALLETFSPNVVVADYDFGIFPFINEVRQKRPDLPFIIVSEIELIQMAPKQGLNIYVLKSELPRIPLWLDALKAAGVFSLERAEWGTQINQICRATEKIPSHEREHGNTSGILAATLEHAPEDPLKKWTEKLEQKLAAGEETTLRMKPFRADPLCPPEQ